MYLYIIRHGDPDYEHNTITPFGHKEAMALAEWFDKMHIRFDEIYTSPLGRAKDTAQYTCQAQGIVPTVLDWTEERMDYMCPFMPSSTVSYAFSSKGIENYVDFSSEDRTNSIHRLIESSDSFLKEHGYERCGSHYTVNKDNDKRIAVFCHGGFGSAWTAHLLGLPPSLGFPSMFMTTTSVNVFEFRPYSDNKDYAKPRMLLFGEVAHLHDKNLGDDRIY